MPYSEPQPRPLSLDALTVIHGFSTDVGPDLTSDMLMNSYWLRRHTSYPIEEGLDNAAELLMYDADWEALIGAGVPPLREDDSRIGSVDDDTRLPVLTSLRPSVLFDRRENLQAFLVEAAETKMAALKSHTKTNTLQAIGSVGLARVNELLGLLGVSVDEEGDPTYAEVDEAQLEGARHVARLMSGVYRDFVRMNPDLMLPTDIEAVAGTEIEDPDVKRLYELLTKFLGNKDEQP